MTFDYEHIDTIQEVREHIQNCEGRHTQQAIYSTFHDALTQVCFGCQKVRTTVRVVENYESNKPRIAKAFKAMADAGELEGK